MNETDILVSFSPAEGEKMKLRSWFGMIDLLTHELFLDTNISVEDKMYKSNKLFLASVSPFFRSMYTSGFKESVDGNVGLGDITCKMFDKVLSFLLNDFKLKLDCIEDVLELLCCASQLQIVPLVDALSLYLEDVLPRGFYPEYVSLVWKLARLHGISSLESICLQLIRESFVTLDFTCLDIEEMKTLLMDSNIQLETFLEPSEVIVNWISQDLEARERYIPDLAHCLKFEDAEALLDDGESIFKDILVQSETALNEGLQNVESSILKSPFSNHDLIAEDQAEKRELKHKLKCFVEDNIRSKQVSCYENFETRNVSVTIVLQDKNAKFLPCIYDTDPGSVGLYGLLIDQQFKSEFELVKKASCVYEQTKLFISGGVSDSGTASSSLLMFDNDCKWKKCSPMTKARSGHFMLSSPVTKSVFVFGGLSNEEILDYEEYSISEDKWVSHGTTELLNGSRQFKIYPCTFPEIAVFFVVEGMKETSPEEPEDLFVNGCYMTQIIHFDYDLRQFQQVACHRREHFEQFLYPTSMLLTEGQYIYSVNETTEISRWFYNCSEPSQPVYLGGINHGDLIITKEFGLEVRHEMLFIRGGTEYDNALNCTTVIDVDNDDDYRMGYRIKYTEKSRACGEVIQDRKLPHAMKGVFWARMYIKRKHLGKKFVFPDSD